MHFTIIHRHRTVCCTQEDHHAAADSLSASMEERTGRGSGSPPGLQWLQFFRGHIEVGRQPSLAAVRLSFQSSFETMQCLPLTLSSTRMVRIDGFGQEEILKGKWASLPKFSDYKLQGNRKGALKSCDGKIIMKQADCTVAPACCCFDHPGHT